MASSYFCPEEPRPLSVISESYARGEMKGQLPELPPWERYSFGEEYENHLFDLMHQYLELNTTDTVCYVGDTRDCLIYRLEEHFCLQNPVQTVQPGRFHYQETPDHKMLPIHIAHVGAEEFFTQMVRRAKFAHEAAANSAERNETTAKFGGETSVVKFDKILVHDACRYLSDPRTFYANVMRCLAPGGIMLILHRPARLSTLPVFKEAQERLAANDVPYMSVVQDMYALGPDVDLLWEVESLPVTIPKRKWLAMVRDRYPPPLQLMTPTEIVGGLRELTEGMLKYEGDQVEFNDNLLFARVTRSKNKSNASSRRTTEAKGQSSNNLHLERPSPLLTSAVPKRRDLKLSMTLTSDARKAGSPVSSYGKTQSTFKFLWD